MSKKNNTLPSVLITGCSSGAGHAAALRFIKAGYPTFATARRLAYDLGFESPQYFSKLFKTKTNMSPSEFRNLN